MPHLASDLVNERKENLSSLISSAMSWVQSPFNSILLCPPRTNWYQSKRSINPNPKISIGNPFFLFFNFILHPHLSSSPTSLSITPFPTAKWPTTIINKPHDQTLKEPIPLRPLTTHNIANHYFFPHSQVDPKLQLL